MTTFYHGSVPHDVTPRDALWLARALDGEGGDERAVAATLVQRWILLGGAERMSLGDMVQAYCQAISPLWLADGARCRPGGIGHGTPACAPERTASRARRRARRWDDIRQEARDATVWALYTEELPDYLPTSVHYATRELVARKMRSRQAREEGWQAVEGPPDGHTYLSTTDSRNDLTRLRVAPGPIEELNQVATLRDAYVAPRAPRPRPRPGGEVDLGEHDNINLRRDYQRNVSGPPLLLLLGGAAVGLAAVSRRRRV